MNAIPPTSLPASLAAATRGATPVQVEQVAPEIARMSAGTILNGVVVARDAAGAVHIRTDHGALVVRTPMQLPEGAAVKIQLQMTGNQTRAVVLSVDPRPGQPAPLPPARPSGTATPGADLGRPPSTPTQVSINPSAAAPQTSIRPGAIVTAQIIQPPTPMPPGGAAPAPVAGQAGATGAPPSPAAGNTLTLRIVDVVPAQAQPSPPPAPSAAPAQPAPPPSPPAQTPAPAPPAAVPQGAGSQAANPSASPAGSAPNPASGAPMDAAPAGTQATRSSPPSAPPVAPQTPSAAPSGAERGAAPAQAQQVYSGNVMGASAGGPTYLATPIGRLSIPSFSALPPNSIVRFEVVPGPAAPSATAGTPAPPASSALELARDWPALRELTQTLSAANPAVAARVADSLIPQAGPRLGQALLLFINALRLGDIGGWLGGRTAGELRAAVGGDLVSRIGDDFQHLARLSAESSQSEWRAYLVPFHDGDRLQQMRLFHRRYNASGSEHDGERGDRFLIDLELSRLGPMQLDGLLQAKRFSLILRSGTPLDPTARQDLTALFADGCACAGITGEISFAGARDFVPLPLDPAASAAKPLTA